MLKKGVPVKFTKHDSLMKRVFEAIEGGESTITRISLVTRLPFVQVRRACHFLSFSGNVVAVRERWRFVRYYTPEGLPKDSDSMGLDEVMQLFNIKATCDEK